MTNLPTTLSDSPALPLDRPISVTLAVITDLGINPIGLVSDDGTISAYNAAHCDSVFPVSWMLVDPATGKGGLYLTHDGAMRTVKEFPQLRGRRIVPVVSRRTGSYTYDHVRLVGAELEWAVGGW